MANMIPISGGQVHPYDNLFAAQRPLPSRTDREKFIEQARLLLAAARTISEQSDRCFTLPSAPGRSCED
jgi:hypothetical protein